MPTDPKYVRLVDRLARGIQVDLNSGWSIAGLDVQPFPDSDNAAAVSYVRGAIARGTLEGCSQAEYEEVLDADHDALAAAGVTIKPIEIEGHYQEGHVVAHADAVRRELESSRGLAHGGSSYKADVARKARILKEAKSSESDDDYYDDGSAEGVQSGPSQEDYDAQAAELADLKAQLAARNDSSEDNSETGGAEPEKQSSGSAAAKKQPARKGQSSS